MLVRKIRVSLILPTPSTPVNPLDLFSGEGGGSEFQTLDISKGQKLMPEKADKAEPEVKSTGLGNLLGGGSDEDSSSANSNMPKATNPISQAVDDMLPDDTMGGALAGGKSGASSSGVGMPKSYQ